MAAGECLVLSWPVALWPEFVARYDGFAAETHRTVGARIGEMNNRLVELATLRAERRVASALLRLVDAVGPDPTGLSATFRIGSALAAGR